MTSEDIPVHCLSAIEHLLVRRAQWRIREAKNIPRDLAQSIIADLDVVLADLRDGTKLRYRSDTFFERVKQVPDLDLRLALLHAEDIPSRRRDLVQVATTVLEHPYELIVLVWDLAQREAGGPLLLRPVNGDTDAIGTVVVDGVRCEVEPREEFCLQRTERPVLEDRLCWEAHHPVEPTLEAMIDVIDSYLTTSEDYLRRQWREMACDV